MILKFEKVKPKNGMSKVENMIESINYIFLMHCCLLMHVRWIQEEKIDYLDNNPPKFKPNVYPIPCTSPFSHKRVFGVQRNWKNLWNMQNDKKCRG
jgi:hypothetical protein